MKKLLIMLVAVALGGCFATVRDDRRRVDGEAAFTLTMPEELPPLVVVQPGVSVVSDWDNEVFYADGYYWVRQDRTWFHSRDHRRGWARVEERRVPAAIVQSPPGRYRHYRGDGHARSDQEDGNRHGHGGDRN
jgi:hypothetical protein